MIDFRYHLVSLVSVFLALAVGIVLGAGPLEGSIGTQLQGQVDDLRTSRDQLRGELERTSQGVQHREDYLAALAPSVLSDRLAGRSVVVVVLPGVDRNALDPIDEALDEAGASLSGTVELAPSWVTPSDAESRDGVAADLVAALPAGTLGPTAPTTLDELLAGVLLSDTGAAPITPPVQAVLDGLQGADLVNLDGDLRERADEAFVVVPPVSGTNASTPTAGSEDELAAWAALAGRLDDAGRGSVVLGPASSAGSGGVLQAVRADDELAASVSTVDTGGSQMGVLASVLALAEQLAGRAGAYGFEDGAEAPLPSVTTSGAAGTGATTAP